MKSNVTKDFRKHLNQLPASVRDQANNEIYWFWIGPHGEYDELLKRL
jgi:hypothetical protein